MPRISAWRDPDIALFQTFQLPRDILGPALPHHQEQESGHEDVIGPAVDERHVMVRSEGSAELGGGDDPAAPAAQHDDLFTSIVVVHP